MKSADFTVVLRGYDRAQVDAAVATAEGMRAAGQIAEAKLMLAGKRFDIALRGYDRGQVSAYLEAWGGL